MTEDERIEQLAALLDGELPADDAAPGLRGLLLLAEGVRDQAELAEPDPVFRAALRHELLAAQQVAPGPLERAARGLHGTLDRLRSSARAAVAAGTAAALVGGVGAAAAAQQSVPGDLLHPLKEATEAVRLALVGEGAEGGRLQLELARERLHELGTGRVDDADGVIALLREMDRRSSTGADLLLRSGDPEARTLLDAFVTDQRDTLAPLLGTLPLQARPVAEDSLDLLRRLGMLLALENQLGAEDGAEGASTAPTCDCSLDDLRAAPPAGPDSSDGDAARSEPCDCVEEPGGAAQREPLLLPDALRGGTDGADEPAEDTDGGDDTSDGGDQFGDVVVDGDQATLGDLTDAQRRVLRDTSEPLADLVDGTTDAIDDTTEAVEDTVDDLDEAVQDTTDDLGGLLD